MLVKTAECLLGRLLFSSFDMYLYFVTNIKVKNMKENSTSTAERLLGNGKCNGVLSALAEIVGCSHRPVMGCHQQNHYEGNHDNKNNNNNSNNNNNNEHSKHQDHERSASSCHGGKSKQSSVQIVMIRITSRGT